MFITVEILKRAGACPGYRRIFRRKYPKGVKVTVEECEKVAHLFRWDWAMHRLVGNNTRPRALAYQRYCRAVRKARDALDRATCLTPYPKVLELREALDLERARAFGRLASKFKSPAVRRIKT